jgi:hypothetical protein
MQKFPVNTRQMTPQEQGERAAMDLALETAGGDKARIILVAPDILLVVNRPGFDPHSWRKSLWRKQS